MGSTGTSPVQPLLRADRPTRDKDAQAERALEDRLRTFRPIQGWTLRSATRVMPWMVLACVAALLIAGDRDPMFISALVAAAVAGFLFQVLMRELPEVLQELWNREVLKPDQRGRPSNRPDRSDAQPLEGLARIQIQMNQTRQIMQGLWNRARVVVRPLHGILHRRYGFEPGKSCAQTYLAFLDSLERQLNSTLSWGCGLVIAGAFFMSYAARFSNGSDWWLHPIRWLSVPVAAGAWHHTWFWVYLGLIALEMLLAYALGLLLWRMAVMAVAVARMGATFDFDVKLQHPDHSGGLRPLCDICLTNALILTVPATYLAGWLIVIPAFGASHNRYAFYVQYYESLLAFVFGLAVVAFALPLYAVHRGMLRERPRLRKPLYELGRQIDALTRDSLKEAQAGDVNELKDLRKQQASLTRLYRATSDIPSWPFDRSILRKFGIAQIIPVLSLTGIAPQIVATVERIFT